MVGQQGEGVLFLDFVPLADPDLGVIACRLAGLLPGWHPSQTGPVARSRGLLCP
ncbi:hypothetical protein [Streptomyces sp. NPDC055692]|uniref:hypothetical protein n=1 Tax=Streptomyces sp. NPDC055692 TaxID=3155683 RepID=UPI00343E2DAB